MKEALEAFVWVGLTVGVAGFVATRWKELVKLARLLFPHRMVAHCERCGREERGFSWTVLWRILRHECPGG